MIDKQNNNEANDQQTVIEDLTISQDQAAEVKGGPVFMEIEGIKGSVTSHH